MSSSRVVFDINGVHCYPLGDRSFCCVPAAPVPERDPAGRPTLSLWVIPPKARLQLGSQWSLIPAEAAAVQAELARRSGVGASEIQLTSAPLHVDTAALVLVDQDGVSHDLATSASSGFPPYTALFAVALEEDAAPLVVSAVNGARDRLFVEYRARVETSTPLELAAVGDITAEVIGLRPPLTLQDATAVVRQALSTKHLAITRTGPDGVPEEVWAPLQDRLLAAVADDVQRLMAADPPAPPTQVSIARVVTGDYRVADSLTRRCDIADWFADGSGPSHIRALDMPPAGSR